MVMRARDKTPDEIFCSECNLPLHRKSFDPKDLAGGRYICLDCRKWLRKVERIKIQIRLRGEEWAWGKKSELERAAAAYNEALKQTKRRK